MDYQKAFDELNEYLKTKDRKRYLQRYQELMKSIVPNSEEYVEMIMIQFTYSLIFESDYNQILTEIDNIESIVFTFGSKVQKIRFSINKGITFGRINRYESAVKVYNEVLRLCDNVDYRPYKISVLINLGVVFTKKYEYFKALRYFLDAYKLNQESSIPIKHTSILTNLGVLYLNIQDYQKSVYYFELCLKTLPKSKQYSLASVYNNLLYAYSKVGKFDHVKEIITKVEKDLSTYNQVNLHYYNKALAEYYVDSGQIDLAIDKYKQLINDFHNQHSSILADYRISLADLYLQKKELKDCKSLIDDVEEMGDFSQISSEKIQFLRLKSNYYNEIADYKSAYLLVNQITEIGNENLINVQRELVNELTQPMQIDVKNISNVAYNEKISELETLNNDLKTKEKLLIDSLNELERESQLRERLISIISHDIRSPIGNIIQLLEMLDDFEDEQEKEGTINEIIEAMKQTLGLTNELVSWAKDIIAKKDATSNPINICELIDNCELFLKQQLSKKHLSINNMIDPEIELYAHKATIETIFRNIISNAIKYSNEYSHIDIASEISDEEVVFTIKDYGRGMSQDEVANIFNSVKISTLGTNAEDGIGIGLLLAQELVHKSNGRIECESILGHGTSFKIFFGSNSLI